MSGLAVLGPWQADGCMQEVVCRERRREQADWKWTNAMWPLRGGESGLVPDAMNPSVHGLLASERCFYILTLNSLPFT